MGIEIGRGDLLLRLLEASALRSRVIANNVANQNTPGYRREVVRFEDLVGARMREGRETADLAPLVTTDELTPPRPDGNNVNLELELNAARENRLLYESYTAILRGRFELIRASIEESR